MAKINTLVQDFLAQKRVAVVGVSDKRETGCNAAYNRFRSAGYAVIPVNPRLTEFQGEPCYPDLKSIPADIRRRAKLLVRIRRPRQASVLASGLTRLLPASPLGRWPT